MNYARGLVSFPLVWLAPLCQTAPVQEIRYG